MLRAIRLLSALALLLSSTSQAAFASAAPASLPPATSENASTAFLNDGSESRIGLLCHNDPVNKTDPFGLEPLAKGLIDIPEKALRQTYDNGKDAANQSLRNNDRRSQTERRTDTFNDNGKVRNTETTTGYKWPSPQAPPPKLPPGVPESARLTQAHDHVGSPAKHYGGDKASANDTASGGRFPLGSGVSSTSDRGVTQEFYIPSANQADRAANRGGAFFITNDGIHFTPAPYHP